MRASIFKVFLVILAVSVVATGQTLRRGDARAVHNEGAAAVKVSEVTTTRGAQGEWFIEGGTLYEAYEAVGYASATDRLWQMDVHRRIGTGRMSEILGNSGLETDIYMRTTGYSDEEYDAQFAALSEDAQVVIQAYLAGVNRRIGEIYQNWNLMPFEYWLLGLQSVLQGDGTPVIPTPFTVKDILGFAVFMTRNFEAEGSPGNVDQIYNYVLIQTLGAVYPEEYMAMFHDLRWINDPGALTYIPSTTKRGVVVPDVDLSTVKLNAIPNIGDAATEIRERSNRIQAFLDSVGGNVKMGSYAWAVSGDKTTSGNPILYSGPQMEFDVPSRAYEGSIRGGGFEISGMLIPPAPMVLIGRTPHHAWSMQVGHAHSVDIFAEVPQTVALHRVEHITVLNGEDIDLPVFRSSHGPIISPMPYNPEGTDPIFAWAYSHWQKEAQSFDAFLDYARAEGIEEFTAGVEKMTVSQHTTYVDRDGNIAYWMSGYEPVRQPTYNPFFPQPPDGSAEWTGDRVPIAHDANTPQGYYGGWNNKASMYHISPPNNLWFVAGPAHRAQVIEDYLAVDTPRSFDDLKNLAMNINTTDSFSIDSETSRGGNTWAFMAPYFNAAVANNPSDDRDTAVQMLAGWDGHFVAGGPTEWPMGMYRADAWVLQEAWIMEVMRLTLEDEFMMAGMDWLSAQPTNTSFNVLVHALAGAEASLPNYYDWFQDKTGSGKPTTAEGIIVQALDNVIADMGLGPYNAERGYINHDHLFLGTLWQTPYSNRSTFAHVVEYDMNGPIRIESMFSMGESGDIRLHFADPVFDPNYFSMVPVYDPQLHRPFPIFN